MSKRPSRLTSSVQNPLACWREKSATFTVLPNHGAQSCALQLKSVGGQDDCEPDCEKPKC